MSKTMSSLARFTRDVVVTIARNATTIDRNTRWVREQDEEWYPTKLSDGITVMAFCDDGCGNGQDCYSTTYRTCVQRFCVDCDDRITTGPCDDCRISLILCDIVREAGEEGNALAARTNSDACQQEPATTGGRDTSPQVASCLVEPRKSYSAVHRQSAGMAVY